MALTEEGKAWRAMGTHIFPVEQLGIKDIDGYGHIWYGNYIKFFERGLQEFLGGGVVRRVEHLKYKKSVAWGAADSRIESYLVERPAPGMALVYQRWCVGTEQDDTNALCLMLVALEPGIGDQVPVMSPKERLERNGPKLAMAVKNLQTGMVKPIVENIPVFGRLLIDRRVFPDMLPPNSQYIQLVDVMDLFEQSRTEVVGGQPGLKAFLDRGLALVVGQIDELVLADDVKLTAGQDIICEVTLIRENVGRRCFDFQQRLLRSDNCEVARVRVLMCCVDPSKGELVPVPEDSWNEWMDNMAKRGSTAFEGFLDSKRGA